MCALVGCRMLSSSALSAGNCWGSRYVACECSGQTVLRHLEELNPNVTVQLHTGTIDEKFLAGFNVSAASTPQSSARLFLLLGASPCLLPVFALRLLCSRTTRARRTWFASTSSAATTRARCVLPLPGGGPTIAHDSLCITFDSVIVSGRQAGPDHVPVRLAGRRLRLALLRLRTQALGEKEHTAGLACVLF